MRPRLSPLIVVFGWLALATLSFALPPPSDLNKREKRNLATRPTPTPTPMPTVAPVMEPVAVPVATPNSTRTKSVTRTTAPPVSRATPPPVTRITTPTVTRVAAPRPTVTTTSTTSARTRESIPPEKRPSTVVVIDAGHGGFDFGGIPRQRVPEKTMNLDVALRLRSILQANGYRVVMTRDTDVFIPLGTRVAIANSYRDAIFVCIHFNAAPRSGANGIETYFYSNESLPLASAIHYHVAGGAPTPNRGVRRRGFFVLRKTRIPAVLVECGFLTNATEARNVQDANYRQKLAEEIAAGVRGRSNVSSSARVAVAGAVPLQPFIDQTRVRDPDLMRSKRSKKSKSKSSKHRMSSDTDAEKITVSKKKSSKTSSDSDDEPSVKKKTSRKASSDSDNESSSKKKSAKKASSDSDDEGGAPKKKSSRKASSDSDDSGIAKKKKSSSTKAEN